MYILIRLGSLPLRSASESLRFWWEFRNEIPPNPRNSFIAWPFDRARRTRSQLQFSHSLSAQCASPGRARSFYRLCIRQIVNILPFVTFYGSSNVANRTGQSEIVWNRRSGVLNTFYACNFALVSGTSNCWPIHWSNAVWQSQPPRRKYLKRPKSGGREHRIVIVHFNEN